MFEQNFALLEKRWPGLAEQINSVALPESLTLVEDAPESTLVIAGIQLSSRYGRLREASLQAALVPAGSSYARVYGLALGDLPRVLLQRAGMEKLSVVLMNLQVVRASLSYFDHSDWLADPRVELLSAAGEEDLHFPLACSAACLYLADESSARLRDQLFLELSTPYLKQQQSARANVVQERLQQNEAFIRKHQDVTTLFGTLPGKTVVVAGAGPTLADQYQWLTRERERFCLVAVDAALRSLIDAGIVPDILLTADTHVSLMSLFFDGVDFSRLSETKLVYFPVVVPELLQAWPGDCLTTYSWQDYYQQLAAVLPRGELHTSGSVIHPAVDLAVKMGARNIVLVGADFSFTKGQTHVTGHQKLVLEEWSQCWVLNGNGERVATSQNFRGFLCDLERYIAWHPEVNFYNTSNEGAHIKGTELWQGEFDGCY